MLTTSDARLSIASRMAAGSSAWLSSARCRYTLRASGFSPATRVMRRAVIVTDREQLVHHAGREPGYVGDLRNVGIKPHHTSDPWLLIEAVIENLMPPRSIAMR